MYEVIKPSGELIKEFKTQAEAQDYAFNYFNDGHDDRSTDVVLVIDSDNNVLMSHGGITVRDIVSIGAGKKR